MTRFAIRRVSATPAALDLIDELAARHGPVAFFQPRCSDAGDAAICVTKAELLPTPDDVKIGEIGGAPFYVDSESYADWGRPILSLDVADGGGPGISLEGAEGVHFVSLPLGQAGALRRHAISLET